MVIHLFCPDDAGPVAGVFCAMDGPNDSNTNNRATAMKCRFLKADFFVGVIMIGGVAFRDYKYSQ
jgi:hypothetical protein